MCGPDPCTSPTPCGGCERGAARLAAIDAAARHRIDDTAARDATRHDDARITRMLRVMPATSD